MAAEGEEDTEEAAMALVTIHLAWARPTRTAATTIVPTAHHPIRPLKDGEDTRVAAISVRLAGGATTIEEDTMVIRRITTNRAAWVVQRHTTILPHRRDLPTPRQITAAEDTRRKAWVADTKED
jgi:hypothetical protein